MYKLNEITLGADEHNRLTLTLDISSNTLPGVTVDTYQTFTGDSSDQMFLEGQTENGESGEWDDYDWTYDHDAIHRGLAEASIEAIVDQFCKPGGAEIIQSIELLSTWSPREYNFRTDSYTARYTLTVQELERWAGNNFSLPDYVRDFHQSYDGYADFVKGYLEDDERRVGTIIWLKLAAYFRAELDTEAYMNYMSERESEIYSSNTTVTPVERD